MNNANYKQASIPATFESIEQAITDVVRALGGSKKVGPMLWSGMDTKKAERRLDDCLNSDRAQKLDPDELKRLARWGRDIGVHSIMDYLCFEAGYNVPSPLSPADEKAELERKTIEAVGYMRHLVERAEAIYGKR